MNPKHEAVVYRLRVELYTAAQVMKGEDLDAFKELIREIAMVLDLSVPPPPSDEATPQ